MRRRAFALLPCLAAALALSGCEDDTVARPEGSRITVRMTDFHLSPPTVVVPEGRYVIVAHNDGKLPHRFALGRGRAAVGRPPIIAPSRSISLRITVPPGRYRMFCALSNHDVLGMYGRVVVRRSKP